MKSGRSLGLLAVTVAAVIAGALTLHAAWPSSEKAKQSGPLAGGPVVSGDPVSYGQPVDIGKHYSYGLLWVRNEGKDDASLDRASLVNASKGIKVLGMYALNDNRHAIGFITGFTPAWGSPVRGALVRTGAHMQIVVGLALTRPGRHTFDAIALEYKVRGARYLRKFPTAGRLCAPADKYAATCHAPRPRTK